MNKSQELLAELSEKNSENELHDIQIRIKKFVTDMGKMKLPTAIGKKVDQVARELEDAQVSLQKILLQF